MATSKNLLAFLKIKGQLKKQNKNLACLIQYIIFCKPGEQPSQIYLIYLSFVETGTLTRSYSQVPRGTFLKLWRQHIYIYNSKCEISSGVSFFFFKILSPVPSWSAKLSCWNKIAHRNAYWYRRTFEDKDRNQSSARG